MPLPGTTGTDKSHQREAVRFAVLEGNMPSAVAALAGAATLNQAQGKVTSEALTTAAGADYTLTLTDSLIAAADMMFASVALGTSTQGDPIVGAVTPGAGSATIVVRNAHATQALNGTIVISFMVVKKAGAPL